MCVALTAKNSQLAAVHSSPQKATIQFTRKEARQTSEIVWVLPFLRSAAVVWFLRGDKYPRRGRPHSIKPLVWDSSKQRSELNRERQTAVASRSPKSY
jgi:hypothetical protein